MGQIRPEKEILMVSKFWGFVAASALVAVPAASLAQFSETEANNTFATGNFFDRSLFGGTGAIAIDGHISPGDVDFFRFDFFAGDFIAVMVATPNPDSEDTILGIFAPDGSIFDTDDDDGPGFNSAWSGTIPSDGRWGIAVSGFSDFDFVGRHEQEFDYKLVIGMNPVPEPATMTAVAAGLAALALRRRKK